MFCPVCRDEYRPGFTRCATCDVDLVAALPAQVVRPQVTEADEEEEQTGTRIAGLTVDFCGFHTLEEARDARNKLRAAKLPSEILITEGPNTASGPGEEYWLRARPRDFPKISAIIGFEPADAEIGEEGFKCSACGETVGDSDAACPGCGLKFEE